jgi:hypothetical protein
MDAEIETLAPRKKIPDPLPEAEVSRLIMGDCDPDLFRQWRASLGLSRIGAAEELGMGRNQPQRYEDGQPIPKYVAMAMASFFLKNSTC